MGSLSEHFGWPSYTVFPKTKLHSFTSKVLFGIIIKISVDTLDNLKNISVNNLENLKNIYILLHLIYFTQGRLSEHVGIQRGNRGQDPHPLKITKIWGFLAILVRIPSKAKPAFNDGPSSAHQRIQSYLMAFLWRADNGPLLVIFWSSLPWSIKKRKRCQSWTPSHKTCWIRTCSVYKAYFSQILWYYII